MPTLLTTMVQVLAPLSATFLRTPLGACSAAFGRCDLGSGKRTVLALRAVGLQQERRFCCYHGVLSRAVWSSRQASRVLLGLLVETFVPEGPLVVGIDETLERRRGKKIAAKGIYRDIRLDLAIPTSSRGAL